MSVHLSARVAWHNDGWNGRICREPAHNTFCIGPHSYPGDRIARERDLDLETRQAGACAAELCKGGKSGDAGYIPPCVLSINAFGDKKLTATSAAPDFFKDGTPRREWDLPPATVGLWPYEEMYGDEVKLDGGGFDAQKRRDFANAYFAAVQPDASLVFYYSNYSNPFSEDEEQRYVLVGVSRVKSVGEEVCWTGQSLEIKEKYGPNVWARNLTSHYPDQGFRVPYHLYRERPDVMERLLWLPEDPRLFKYATRQFDDDAALSLIERALEVVGTLREIGDTSEDWAQRESWLHGVLGELWRNRGLYPGMARVLNLLGCDAAIPYFRREVAAAREKEAFAALWAFLQGQAKAPAGVNTSEIAARSISRQWKLRENDEQRLLREVLPRFDLSLPQIEMILAPERHQNGLGVSLDSIAENPYLLCENFVGQTLDDGLGWNTIDHGMFPSPDLGGEALATHDDPRRLRALCVERLTRENRHTFVEAAQIIAEVNHRLSFLPEWKRHQFTPKYLEVDDDIVNEAIVQREENGILYLYLRHLHEAERHIETSLRFLANGPDIELPRRNVLTPEVWRGFLFNPNSALAEQGRDEYEAAITDQSEVCARIFRRPLAVLCGAAGTGKTTVIKALIGAIERVHGSGTSFQLLAPTGKAADRIRKQTGKEAITIHSFLARNDWLNPNLTLRTRGGKTESKNKIYIIDEASMLDLEVAGALFRAIDWATVQRVLFVGDPNQLPPIGRGRVFADLIEWLRETQPEAVAELSINLRQMENRLKNQGTGILDLASLYVHPAPTFSISSDAAPSEAEVSNQARASDEEARKAEAEQLLGRVQEGGDVDRDLRVVFWDNQSDLEMQLMTEIISGMAIDTTMDGDDEEQLKELWKAAWSDGNKGKRPEYLQVLTPYRGEFFGTDNLNVRLQARFNGSALERFGSMDGITLFDKVIQIRNRPKSDKIHAWDTQARQTQGVEIYNGEIGFVKPHGFDKNLGWSGFFLKHFQAIFAGKEHLWVGYGRDLGKNTKGYYIGREPVSDNLELGYAISVHKAQGSEFDRVYLVLPKQKATLLSPELFYTALTRASHHVTILVQEDIAPFLQLRRREASHLLRINSSLLRFRPAPRELQNRTGWFDDKKIYATLADVLVQSKSEVIIANLLTDRGFSWEYERPLYAPDGTFYLPDFTITWRGQELFWEHWGMIDDRYINHMETKRAWYAKNFPGRLLETFEAPNLTEKALAIITEHLGNQCCGFGKTVRGW